MSVLDHLNIVFTMTFHEAYNIFASIFEHWPDKVVFRDNKGNVMLLILLHVYGDQI